MMILPLLLAQSPAGGAPPQRDTASVMIWVGVLLGLVIAGGLFALWMRRRLLASEAANEASVGLLEGMRRMRDQGQISPEEYDSMRRAITKRSVEEMDARTQAQQKQKKGRAGTRTGTHPPITTMDPDLEP